LGTLDAVRKAYERHKERLLTVAFGLTGDRAAAEDVVHDVFARVLQNSSWPSGQGAQCRYLVVCVRNQALDWLRYRKRHRTESSKPPEISSDVEGPGAAAARQEQTHAALHAVNELPGDLREVIVLRIWGGLAFRQIARLQGIGKSTAHERYNRALAEVEMHLTGRSPT
jgi:RNA polymerase sigma-70 factor (ECF subfamily)